MKIALSNCEIAELLAREAEGEDGIRQRAFKRAARNAFLWPERAADIFLEGRSLLELKGIGPFLAPKLRSWLEQPPKRTNAPPLLSSVVPEQTSVGLLQVIDGLLQTNAGAQRSNAGLF